MGESKGTSGRAVLNWSKNTYTRIDDVDEKYNDYHAQGIGNITGTPPETVNPSTSEPPPNPLSILDGWSGD